MIALAIKTDQPIANIALLKDGELLSQKKWQADKQLSGTLHIEIAKNLQKLELKLIDLDGIVVYKGPGSFTGLRIGMSVANTLAYSLMIPVAAENGDSWVNKGLEKIASGNAQQIAAPYYGAPVRITTPKK